MKMGCQVITLRLLALLSMGIAMSMKLICFVRTASFLMHSALIFHQGSRKVVIEHLVDDVIVTAAII